MTFDNLWGQAGWLYERNQLHAALGILSQMLEKWPHHPDVLRNIGVIHLKLKQHDIAIDYLRKATARSPEDELASRSYFLALWGSGHDEEALAEASRFTQLTKSYPKKYQVILKGILEALKQQEQEQIAAHNVRNMIAVEISAKTALF
jgi:tetratricopeptide (TPR) repeat protein